MSVTIFARLSRHVINEKKPNSLNSV